MIEYLRGNWLTRLFYGLYVSVAVATFRHSAMGFASIEGGSFAWGALSALAVDAGMILSATSLRQRRSLSPFIGLVVSAVASTYTQLLYSVSNAAFVSPAPGAQWLGDAAQNIIDARVLALPALLPALAVIYAFSAKRDGRKSEPASDFDAQVAEILAQTSGKQARAKRIWELADNGHAYLTPEDVAELAGCHPATARKMREAD